MPFKSLTFLTAICFSFSVFAGTISRNDRKTEDQFDDEIAVNIYKMYNNLKELQELTQGSQFASKARSLNSSLSNISGLVTLRHYSDLSRQYDNSLLRFKETWEDNKWDFIRLDKAFKKLKATLPSDTCFDDAPDSRSSCEDQVRWGKCDKDWMKDKCNKSCGRCAATGNDERTAKILNLYYGVKSFQAEIEGVLYWVDERRCNNLGTKDCQLSPLCNRSGNYCKDMSASCENYSRYPSGCSRENNCYYDNSRSICRDQSDSVGYMCIVNANNRSNPFIGTGRSESAAQSAALSACERFNDRFDCRLVQCEAKW